jgi:nitric oxide reductase large subunit
VDTTEKLSANESFEGLDTECKLAQGKRTLCAKTTRTKASKVAFGSIVRTVINPKVFTASAFHSGLSKAALATVNEIEWLDYHAGSQEFMQTDIMQWLRWLRVPGDTVFFLGAVVPVVFVVGLKTGHSFRKVEAP